MSSNGENDTRTNRNPAFHITEPNPLLGSRVQLIMNATMARQLCDKLEECNRCDDCQISQEEKSLYAMLKNIRRYYYNLHQQRAAAETADDVVEVGQEGKASIST